MTTLKIHHRTTYRYRQPVSLGPHRLMLRPRESRDLRIVSSDVTVTPAATLTWAHDVFGNAVATATFQNMASTLAIESAVELDLNAAPWPVFDIAASAIVYPFQYSADEFTDLGALAIQQYPDPTSRLRDWARAFVRGDSTNTLALLQDLCAGVSNWINYQSREEEGTQQPLQTLDRGWGSCRDFAVLFVEFGAQPRFWGEDRVGLSVQSRSALGVRRCGVDACLGGSLCNRRGLDKLRSDEPHCRRLQPDPRGRRARHQAGDARVRQLRRDDRCIHGHGGGS